MTPGLTKSVAFVVLAAIFVAAPLRAQRVETPASATDSTAVAGSATCRSCHEKFYGLWAGSWHGLAMRPYSDNFAAANLTAQTTDIAVGEASYRVEIGPGEGWVRERAGDVERRYRIVEALGGKDVVYLLTEFDRGRLQTLPVAYDVRKREWFDMAASGAPHASPAAPQPLDWKDRRFTFNMACRGCHVSQIANAYDPATDAYRTNWSEPGVNCETCHGPGQAHIDACLAAPAGKPPEDLRIIRIKRDFDHAQTNALCGACHAKATPITASFAPGDRFSDHFELAAYDNPDFYPDGRDLGENYTYTSWSRSPCVAAGELDCLHCHTSSGRYKFADADHADDACQPCHAGVVADAAGHSHHPAGTRGARCVACHMPTTEFARMRRSDHSMLPPTPAASLAYGSPNACTICHADRDAAWADAAVRGWYGGGYQAPLLDQAALIAAARRGDWGRLADMLAVVASPASNELIAATLTRLLRSCPDPRKWDAILDAARSPSPLTRAAAAEALAALASRQAVDALAAASADDSRVVRVRAAASLAGLPADALRLSPVQARAVKAATEEHIASLLVSPDSWASQYDLGNFHLGQGDLALAVAAYETATRLDPSAAPPLINAAIAYARLGRNDKAEAALAAALKLEPDNAAAHFNMGLLQAELGDAAAAERHLRAALQARPDMAEAAYNLGVLLAPDRPGEALGFLRQAAGLDPLEPRYAYTLAFFTASGGDHPGAAQILKDLLARRPDYRPAAQLLDAIERSAR
jgi:tetratricopeptide (TPR) repeat protein